MQLIRYLLLTYSLCGIMVDSHCQDFQIIGSDVTTVPHALSHAAILNDSTIIAVGGYG